MPFMVDCKLAVSVRTSVLRGSNDRLACNFLKGVPG